VLGIAANLEKRSVVDGGWVGASAIRPAVDADWVVIYQINAQGDAWDCFEIVTDIDVIVDYCLKLLPQHRPVAERWLRERDLQA
jgi:hypothetical protein